MSLLRISVCPRAKSDPARAQGAQRFFKDKISALGNSTAELRAFAREQASELSGEWQAARAIELCDQLPREPELEIRGAGILIELLSVTRRS